VGICSGESLKGASGFDKSTAVALLSRSHPMTKTAPATLTCQVCKKPKSPHDGTIAELIRPSLVEFIRKSVPDLDDKGFVEILGLKLAGDKRHIHERCHEGEPRRAMTRWCIERNQRE